MCSHLHKQLWTLSYVCQAGSRWCTKTYHRHALEQAPITICLCWSQLCCNTSTFDGEALKNSWESSSRAQTQLGDFATVAFMVIWLKTWVGEVSHVVIAFSGSLLYQFTDQQITQIVACYWVFRKSSIWCARRVPCTAKAFLASPISQQRLTCKADMIKCLTISTRKTHLLTSQLPDGRRKMHECPVDLGEVHLFPDITKWDAGSCGLQPFIWQGIKVRGWRPGDKFTVACWKAKHPGRTRGKGEASPPTQTRSLETSWKHPGIVLQALITLLLRDGGLKMCTIFFSPLKAHGQLFRAI